MENVQQYGAAWAGGAHYRVRRKPLKTTMLRNSSVKVEPEEESEVSFQQPSHSFAQAIARENNGAQSSEALKRGKEVRLLFRFYIIVSSNCCAHQNFDASMHYQIIASTLYASCCCVVYRCTGHLYYIVLLSKLHQPIFVSTYCCINQFLYLPIIALTNSFAFILSHSFFLTSNITPFLLVVDTYK